MTRGHREYMDPDHPLSVKAEPLRLYQLEAKAHWEQFLPTRVKPLKAEGPWRSIRRAFWQTEYASLLEQINNPTLSRQQAESIFRTMSCSLRRSRHPSRRIRTTTETRHSGDGRRSVVSTRFVQTGAPWVYSRRSKWISRRRLARG
jgi:hypothetical protein